MNNQNTNNEMRVAYINEGMPENELQIIQAEHTPPLPIAGFPLALQDIITTCAETYGTPRDYWAGAVLMASTLAIGNKLVLVTNYRNVPILWLVLLGDVSSGKSQPLDFCLEYFKKLDSRSIKKYQEELAEFDRISSLSSKERLDEGITEKPVKPECLQYIFNDFTPEALVDAHRTNNRGMLILRDELKGWFDDFGRYNKSGEQSNMVSSWSGMGITYNRKSSGIMNIEHPCINVCGGMQPDLLHTLAADNRAENGFLSRLCIVYPDNTQKVEYNNNKLPEKIRTQLEEYLSDLINQNSTLELTLGKDAEEHYSAWFNQNVEKTNKEPSGYLKGVYGKLDIVCLRLAVIIRGMKMACDGEYSKEITGEDMIAAIELTEYFRATALKVYRKLFGEGEELSDRRLARILNRKKMPVPEILKYVNTSKPTLYRWLK